MYDQIKNSLLIPRPENRHGALKWLPSDSAELFAKNLLTQPDDWLYRTKEVVYRLNSLGYRCPEFDQIEWAQSIVVKGCSVVEGIGLAEEDTLSSRLADLFNQPVINLGIAGSSILFTLINTYKLLSNNIRPKLVIELYTNTDRSVFFNRKTGEAIHLGSWLTDGSKKTGDGFDESFMEAWAKHSIVSGSEKIKNIFYVGINEMLWQSAGVPLYQACFMTEASKTLNLPSIPAAFGGNLDLARDLMHPGRETIKACAKKIFDNIKEKKLI